MPGVGFGTLTLGALESATPGLGKGLAVRLCSGGETPRYTQSPNKESRIGRIDSTIIEYLS